VALLLPLSADPNGLRGRRITSGNKFPLHFSDSKLNRMHCCLHSLYPEAAKLSRTDGGQTILCTADRRRLSHNLSQPTAAGLKTYLERYNQSGGKPPCIFIRKRARGKKECNEIDVILFLPKAASRSCRGLYRNGKTTRDIISTLLCLAKVQRS
jgi:hypothetical protein